MTHTRNKTLNTNVTVPAAPSASAGSVKLVNTFDIATCTAQPTKGTYRSGCGYSPLKKKPGVSHPAMAGFGFGRILDAHTPKPRGVGHARLRS